MKWRRLLSLVVGNLRASRVNTLLSVVGMGQNIAQRGDIARFTHNMYAGDTDQLSILPNSKITPCVQ